VGPPNGRFFNVGGQVPIRPDIGKLSISRLIIAYLLFHLLFVAKE
jgi:hypothetical protein